MNNDHKKCDSQWPCKSQKETYIPTINKFICNSDRKSLSKYLKCYFTKDIVSEICKPMSSTQACEAFNSLTASKVDKRTYNPKSFTVGIRLSAFQFTWGPCYLSKLVKILLSHPEVDLHGPPAPVQSHSYQNSPEKIRSVKDKYSSVPSNVENQMNRRIGILHNKFVSKNKYKHKNITNKKNPKFSRKRKTQTEINTKPRKKKRSRQNPKEKFEYVGKGGALKDK